MKLHKREKGEREGGRAGGQTGGASEEDGWKECDERQTPPSLSRPPHPHAHTHLLPSPQ